MTGPTHRPDIAGLVDAWAGQDPDREFLVWAPHDEPSRAWTRGEYAASVARLGSALHDAGLGPGDRLALVLPNRPAFVLTWTAVTSIGATAVCLDPRASRDELGYALGHSGSAMVLTTRERAEDVAAAAPGVRILIDDLASPGPTPGADGLGALLAHEVLPRPVPDAAAPASIQYTSGTTARPKGVVWTQANCRWAGQVGARHQGLGVDDTNLLHLPLFHTNALSYSFLSSLVSGGRLVLMPGFSASRFWDVAVRHRATWTSVVSFCLRALEGREVPERHHFRGWASSAALDPGPVTGGVGVTGWFGMTETVSHPICSSLAVPSPPGSMGTAASEYAVSVVDDDGRPVEPGAVGELRVAGTPGQTIFAGYLDAPEQTEAAYDDEGRFRTGDRVRRDDEGHWWFVERDKDVLKVGGENIGAPEVERVLLALPEVREAAVVGRPDRMLGEVPVAFVTLHDGASLTPEQVEDRCVALLTRPKRPREVRIVDSLPRSTLDKVAKQALRDRLRREAEAADE